MEMAVLALVAVVAFVSTSFDSLLVLVPVLSRGRDQALRVAGGYLVALAVIVALSWVVASAGTALMPFDGGLLGLIPLVMGTGLLVRGHRRRRSAPGEEQVGTPSVGPGAAATAILTLSLSADNFAAFVPLLADTSSGGDRVVAVALMLSGAGWVAVAGFLAGRPILRGATERWGSRILPLLLIGLGVYILANTPFDIR